jgi:hypothetical protein
MTSIAQVIGSQACISDTAAQDKVYNVHREFNHQLGLQLVVSTSNNSDNGKSKHKRSTDPQREVVKRSESFSKSWSMKETSHVIQDWQIKLQSGTSKS